MKKKILITTSLLFLFMAGCGNKQISNDVSESNTMESKIEESSKNDESNDSEEITKDETEQAGSATFNGNNLYTSRPYSEFKEKKFDYSINNEKYNCNITICGESFDFPNSLNDININSNLETTKNEISFTDSVNNIEFTFRGGRIFNLNNKNVSVNYFIEEDNIFLITIDNYNNNSNKISVNGVECNMDKDTLINQMGNPTFIEESEMITSYIYEDSKYSIKFDIGIQENIINKMYIYKK